MSPRKLPPLFPDHWRRCRTSIERNPRDETPTRPDGAARIPFPGDMGCGGPTMSEMQRADTVHTAANLARHSEACVPESSVRRLAVPTPAPKTSQERLMLNWHETARA